mgnify:CR=1 FL=1
MDINIAMQICFKNGIEVYPIKKDGYWYIQTSKNGKENITYKKKLYKATEVTSDVSKTYNHLAKKL